MKVFKPNRMGLLEIRTQIRSLIIRRPWSVLSWSSGIAAAAFIVYFGLQIPASKDVGIQFVTAEWPAPSVSPFLYAKPITWFSYLSFMYWAFGLESRKQKFLGFSPQLRRLLFVGTAVIAFGAFYEILFNFTLWSAYMSVSGVLTDTCGPGVPCNPDYLANHFPALPSPVNLVFATKVVTTIFALAVYSLWFLNRVEKETERRYSTIAY